MWWKAIATILGGLVGRYCGSNPLRHKPLAIGHERTSCGNESSTGTDHSKSV